MRRRCANGEGTIYHRKDSRWAAIITPGTGMRKTSYRQTREEALLALQQAQHTRIQGILTSTREETVETFLLNWLRYQIQPRIRERTYQTYPQTVMQGLLPSLGRIAFQEPTYCLRFHDPRHSTTTLLLLLESIPKSCRNCLGTVRSFSPWISTDTSCPPCKAKRCDNISISCLLLTLRKKRTVKDKAFSN